MTSRSSLAFRIIIITAVYFGLSRYSGSWGWHSLYPVRNFSTFLHEFGHAFGALITGGSVDSIQIHAKGGGLAWTRGGNRAVIIMGGYIGSAFLGNLLFYIGAKRPRWVKPTLVMIILVMLITGFVWYRTLFTTVFLCIFAGALFLIGFKTKFGRDVLMFFGLTSVLYIIQNFQIGPSGDLASFEKEIGLFPAKVWMYIWLGIVLILLAINMKMLFNIIEIEEPTPRKRVNTKLRYNPYKKG